MVSNSPDPTDDSPQKIIPPPRHDLTSNGNHDDSDDDQTEYFGYELLPQGPETAAPENTSEDELEENETEHTPTTDVPPIEAMETALSLEIWNVPRVNDPIQMDNDRAQQVMSIMANFALPQTSIPDWAQSIPEEQWKQNLSDRIEKLKGRIE